MENRSHAVVALIFLFVLLIGSAVIAWWMQAGQKEAAVYEIVTAYAVPGLHVQAPVDFKGIDVGTVRQIGFDPRNPHDVRILIGLTKGVPVTKSTFAQLNSNGITGVSTIALRESRSNSPPLKTEPGHPAKIPLRKGLMQQLEASAKKSILEANQIEARLEKLLGQDNQKHIKRALVSLDRATRKLNELEGQMGVVLKSVPPLLNAAKTTVTQGTALIRESQMDARQFQSLMETSQKLVNSLNDAVIPKVDQLSGQLSVTARSLNDLVETLARNPKRAIFGGLRSTPGPGEPGYKPPAAH